MSKLMDHDFDGIQEYDNPPPGWLMFIFYGSILFSIGYVIYYPSFWFWPGTSGWTSTGQYVTEMEVADKQYAAFRKDPNDIALTPDDPAVIAVGEKVYATRCAACHGNAGEGKIGPSMIDSTWVYGGSDVDILKSIGDGRPKGMPAWKKVLKADELQAVASYVRKLNNDAGGDK